MTTTSDRQTLRLKLLYLHLPALSINVFPVRWVSVIMSSTLEHVHAPDDRGATSSKFEARRKGKVKSDRDLSAASPFSSLPYVDRSLLDSSTHSTRYRFKPTSSSESIPKFLLFSSLLIPGTCPGSIQPG
ncbi:hypothetical protein FA13DRAFT_1110910 [Coprinellus micaceus]|uniref:Uncharacterized protein n=1 Tax=Coprinellus micaceus TaxID=71717 RepID=A0A4Y7SWS6_COPMI|nr:hypothetical protein FA13DRAFT_1110910 [Coprinellus micaceus]